MISSNVAAATAIIHQVGEACDIQRSSASGSDAYRNPTLSWSSVGTETVAKVYPFLRMWPEQRDSLSGELDEDNPVLMARKDADIQDGDKIVWHNGLDPADQIEYRVRSITPMATHLRVRAQKI